MATHTPIATVSSVTGEVHVRGNDGQLRQLKAGDQLNEGDVVIPSNGGSVELTMADGNPMTLNQPVEVTLSPDMLTDEAPAVRDEAVTDKSIAAVLEALEAGEDPTDVLPEPAAGAAATGGEGHDFVRLARIVETLTLNDFPSDAAAISEQEFISPDLLEQSVNEAPSITVTANDFVEDAGTVAGDAAAIFVTSEAVAAAFTVTFTAGTNSNGHYVLASGQVELTQAGVDVINAGEVLDPIDLTVTLNIDPSLFGTGSDTPVVTPVDDAPGITVTANNFVEDAGAVAGDVAGTYVTVDEEGDVVTVTFTTGTNINGHYVLANGQVELTQAGVDAINAGEVLDPIDLTVTQNNDTSLFGTGSDTPAVTPVNDAPGITVTANDFVEDAGAVAGDVAGTFVTTDAEGDAVTVTITTGTNSNGHYVLANGQVELAQAGVDAINAGEVLDPIELTVIQDSDPNLFGTGSDTPVVTPVNDAPGITVTANDFVEDAGAVAGDVAGTFVTTDAEGDAVTVTYTTGTNSNGHYVLANGQVELTQAGVDAINAGEALDLIDLTVTQDNDTSLFGTGSDMPLVTPVNDAPGITVTANDFVEDAGAVAGDAAGTYVTADAEGDAVTVTFTTGTNSNGYYVLANGQVELTQAGVDAINTGEALDLIDLTVTQDNDTSLFGTGSDTPLVTPVNDAPVALANSYDVIEEGNVGGNIITDDTGSGVDSDPENDSLSIASVNGETLAFDAEGNASVSVGDGTLIINENGTFSYDHNGEEPTETSFTYTVTDGSQESNTAIVTLAVQSVNDAPIALANSYDVIEEGNVGGNIITDDTGSGIDSDPENDSLSIASVNGETLAFDADGNTSVSVGDGTLTINESGIFSYDHNGEEPAETSFTYTVTDGNLESNTATVTLAVQSENDAPIALDNSYDVIEEGDVGGNIITDDTGSGVDSDSENDSLSIAKVNGETLEFDADGNASVSVGDGTLSINENGTFSYDHNGEEPAETSFTYTVTDGNLESNTATVVLNVEAVDEPITLDMTNSGGTVYDVGLLSDSDNSESTNGSFKVTAPDGLSSVTIAGVMLLVADLVNASELAPLEVFSNADEELVITGYDATNGTINYSYTLIQSVAHAEGSNQTTASFQVTATDLDGSVSAPGFLVITQNDDIPEILSVSDGMGLNGIGQIVGALNIDPSADTPQSFSWGDVSSNVNLYANDAPVIITTDEATGTVTGMLADETMVFTLTLNEDQSSYTYSQYMPIQTEATEALIAQNLSGGNSSSFRLSSSGLEADPIQTLFYGYEYDDDLNVYTRSTVNTSANNMGVGTGQDVDSDSGEQDQLFMSFDQKVTSISLMVDINGNSTAELRYTVYSVQPGELSALGEDGFTYSTLPTGGFSGTATVSDGDTVEIDATSLGVDEFTFIVFEADSGEYKLVPSELTVNYLTESQDFSLTAPFTVTDSDFDSATDSIDIDISGTLASLTGNEFDNALGGDEQDNTLIGGGGDDTLTGGLGSDTFAWNLNDGGTEGAPAVDVISDFDVELPASGGDILDLSELLVSEEGGDLTHYLHFDSDGGDSVLHVSTSGGFTDGIFNEAAVDQVIEFSNVMLDVTDQAALINDLVDSGKLITD